MTDPVRFYDFLGRRYDAFGFMEARAKSLALERLDLATGLAVLNAGLGTGREQEKIQAAVGPEGLAVGLDLSTGMLAAAQARAVGPLVRADVRRLPFCPGRFDRLYCAYVLDLLPAADLPGVLESFRWALRPGGRLVAVSLTEGVSRPSRFFIAAWKLAYNLQPLSCGGCRPLRLAGLIRQAGFEAVKSEVVIQFGVPSEVVTATNGSPIPPSIA